MSCFFSVHLSKQSHYHACWCLVSRMVSPGHRGLWYWELKRYNKSVSATHDIIATVYYLCDSKGIIDAKINILVADGQVPLIRYTWAVIKINVKNCIFGHSELKCARAHVWHVYFRHNFRLGPRSHLNELSKLPSQQLGSPWYYDRCHFERNVLICYSQYYQTFCHVTQTFHLIIFGKSGCLFSWAIIEVCTKSWQWKYILACCYWYWCRFFGTRVLNRYYIVERCCYMCIFMLPTVYGLQTTKWTPCNFGWIFFHFA